MRMVRAVPEGYQSAGYRRWLYKSGKLTPFLLAPRGFIGWPLI